MKKIVVPGTRLGTVEIEGTREVCAVVGKTRGVLSWCSSIPWGLKLKTTDEVFPSDQQQ